MVSFGGNKSKQKSKSKSTSESGTEFNRPFFDQAFDYFGGDPSTDPQYKPEYVGFNDFDQLEKNQYDSQRSKLDDAYRGQVARQREELSQAGLLNSPNQYLEDSARSGLDKDYLSNLQQAARDASSQRLAAQEQEATRKTAYNTDVSKALLSSFFNKLMLALQAGRYSRGSSEGQSTGNSMGGNFSLLNFGGSNSS